MIDAMSLHASGEVRRTAMARDSEGSVSILRDAAGERLMRGAKPLTPPFRAIDSFDVSEERKEIVFSAKRTDNFDIGLVSIDGSDVHWVPEDPADEVAVQWAPRGNKVSFIVRTRTADLVRTVHIPTATQLTVELPPYANVTALAWDAPAERFAVAYDTPDASSRVEVMKYGGEGRHIAIAPEKKLALEIEPLPGGLLLRPASLRYGERLPLVVWIERDPRPRWDDARGSLLATTRSAAAVLIREPDAAFWEAVGKLPWLDPSRRFVVGGLTPPPGGKVIRGDVKLAGGRYRIEDNSVFVAPPIVKSFAAGFVADQLKGTAPENGSIR